MTEKFKDYRTLEYTIPSETWSWNMYGAGTESIGRDGSPEQFAVPEPADHQMLVRVDSVGMCYSDVKLIKQGGAHPKLYNRDLATNPTRLGHEAALTVVKVGKDLQDQYQPGQRLAIQPDIYVDGISGAYGYTIPGGLTQYHLIGPEVLDADDGAYVLPVEEGLGYAETALTEPWACVEAAYTQRRRLTPAAGGWMWIIGDSNDTRDYTFSKYLDAPGTIVLSDVPTSVKQLVSNLYPEHETRIIERNNLTPQDYAALSEELTSGRGFDDIVLLRPQSAEQVTAAAKLIAFRGTFNIIGETELKDSPQLDVGRMHYHYTAYVGSKGPDIAASYGEARNRAELSDGGTAVFVGAGGPMGQMHVQRAIEMPNGPQTIIATEINATRLEALQALFGPLAEKHNKRLITFDPATSEISLEEFVTRETDENGAEDVVVCVPVAALIEDAARLLAPDGMLVLFAGVPNGTFAPIDINDVFLNNMQLTGTSGSKLSDQQAILDKAISGDLSPNRSVAAVGGMEAALDAVKAMMTGTYAGKVVVFPQLSGLPLMGLAELKEKYPELGELMGDELTWNADVERALFEGFWQIADVE